MTATTATDSKKKDVPKEQPQATTANDTVPSGFILKLFQMVNGAPDEVIRWTEDGDAFVIGSDLERLESETLPQYFRHNRFQSLVRQLNFYSFRKINRERNVWIYKHNLFHRDHPEDLYMVRRRTCPGLDGRKQRFSSRGPLPKGANKKSEDNDNAVTTPSDEESGSIAEDHPVIEESPSNDSSMGVGSKKRDSFSRRVSLNSRASNSEQLDADVQPPKSKRSRYYQDTPEPSPQAPGSPVVDFSLLHSLEEANSNTAAAAREDDMPDDSSLDNKRNEKLEMLEQSMIVEDVAMKLEEYAKRARKNGMLPSRVRRPGAGVVTPPFSSSSYQVSMSASELLTYDDEYPAEDLQATELFGIQSTSSVVTDSDVDEVEDRFDVSKPSKELMVNPVPIPQAKSITERLLMSDITSAAVAGFCMSTAPIGNPEMSRKILQLIASCEILACDFHQYREALDPMAHSGDPNRNSAALSVHARMNHMQNWEREGSRSNAVRDFKIFSVNCVRKILEGASGPLPDADRVALKRTADVWLKSINMLDQTRREIQ
ncbi:stress transcription factor B-2b [Seminavis robusta]|uniref:Stress transcription factor B-2b n=1 Tax=Seminavis robusta TaxID=568900 RepID=A0A9N8HBY0_9STRA|nr:stress transcription factor B-2b [Seminavis robusta]|eukprot:Sro200_g084580.1 stress transcription factor B-2b (544) ;mRNA; r:8672-11414